MHAGLAAVMLMLWHCRTDTDSRSAMGIHASSAEWHQHGPIFHTGDVACSCKSQACTAQSGTVPDLQPTSSTCEIWAVSMQMPPCRAAMCPSSEVPAPKGMMGVRL